MELGAVGKGSRAAALGVLALVGLLGSVGLLLWGPAGGPPPRGVPGTHGAPEREPTAADRAGDGARAQAPAATPRMAIPGAGSAGEPSREELEAIEVLATRTLVVRVVDGAGGARDGLRVGVEESGGWGRGASGLTGEGGRCALEVEPWEPGELRAVSVREPEGALLFHAACALEPEILVVLDERALVLRGRLVLEPALELGPIWVAAFAANGPAGEGERFEGRARLDARGSFELEARAELEVAVLRLAFGTHEQELGVADVPLEELLRPEGATIGLALATLTIEARTARGAPAVGAEVRAEVLGDGRGVAPHRALTGAEGHARLLLPRRPFEVAVGLEGHAPLVLSFAEPPPAETIERIVLEPLTPSHRVAGVVLDPRGAPVAGAFVSLAVVGRTSAAFHASFRGARTDRDGRFELATPGNLAFELGAFHRAYGMSQRDTYQVPTGPVTLRFTGSGALRVELRALGFEPGSRDGELVYALLDPEGELLESGRATPSGAFELSELTPGPRELFVLLRGAPAFGRTHVEVPGGERAACTVVLRPGAKLRLRAIDGAGRPRSDVEARALDPALPAALQALWCRAAARGDGGLTLLTSDPAGCRVELRGADGEGWTGFVPARAEVRATLP